MSWMFWKKDDPEYVLETTDVPTSTLLRWYLYDSAVPNPNKHAQSLGFLPISEEGEEMELRESQERLSALDPYVDFLALMSDIAGQTLTETFTDFLSALGVESSGLDKDEEREVMSDLYTSIAVSVLVPAFSAALKLGIVVDPGTFHMEAMA